MPTAWVELTKMIKVAVSKLPKLSFLLFIIKCKVCSKIISRCKKTSFFYCLVLTNVTVMISDPKPIYIIMIPIAIKIYLPKY